MKNYKTVFKDLSDRFYFECSHDVYDDKSISININIESTCGKGIDSFICLDIDSAIKLTKVLRAEINEAKNLQSDYSQHRFKVKPVAKLPKLY